MPLHHIQVLALVGAIISTSISQSTTPSHRPAETSQTMNSSIVTAETNPFFVESALPFQAPPFDKIKDSDYQPAIEEGMRCQRREVEMTANNNDAPTFEQ